MRSIARQDSAAELERPAGRLLETRTFSSGVVYLGFEAR
jgi:hypothetical protein